MSFKVQVRRAAELDIGQAQSWYEAQRAGLGSDFHYQISEVFTELSFTQLCIAIVPRTIVHRFPYLIWYRARDEEVTILACTHARQNPSKVNSRFR